MRRAVIRLAPARADLREIALYIGRHSPQAADRFLRAAERTFAQIAAHPGVGARYEAGDKELGEIRVSPVTRFRYYLIFYRATDDRLEILRVLHGRRDTDRLLADALPPDGDDAP